MPFSEAADWVGSEPEAWAGKACLGALATLVKDGVFLADGRGGMRYVSARAQAMGGFRGSEALGDGWLDLIHPEDRSRAQTSWRAAIAGQEEWREELRWSRRDGDARALWRARPLPPGGPIQGWVGTVTATQELSNENAQMLIELVEHSGDVIEMAALDGTVTFLNRAGLELLGWQRLEPGTTLAAFLTPERRARTLAAIRARQLQGEGWEGEIDFYNHQTQERIPVHTKAFAIRDGEGRPVARAFIARDMRQWRRAEARLQQAERLAAMGRIAATMAHEINNPLATAVNLAYVLRREPGLPAPAQERADQLAAELGRVASVAKHTLAFYRDSPQIALVPLAEVLSGVLGSFAHRISQSGVRVSSDLDADVRVPGSLNELRQVFINLIGNALDFMPSGGELQVRLRPGRSWRPSEVRGARISVADTGPGLEREDRQRIFEPFFTTKADAGVGLGLWISREVIEKHHGTIQARNKLGGGACFHVFLPGEIGAPQGEVSSSSFIRNSSGSMGLGSREKS